MWGLLRDCCEILNCCEIYFVYWLSLSLIQELCINVIVNKLLMCSN